MSRKKKKITKNKKKFFIIAACYIATFIITSLVTTATLSWFNSSTWQSEIMYMGGPVYIYFSDDSGITQTCGVGSLVTKTPDGWSKLYPGMNITFKSKAVVQGKEFNKIIGSGDTITYYTTEAILRAKVMLEVIDTNGSTTSPISTQLYNWIWPQLKIEALDDRANEGVWIFDQQDTTVDENNYFYYCKKNQTGVSTDKTTLLAVGGIADNVSVGFLNNCTIQLPSVELTNEHSDCTLKFTIVFEALQAFLPYEERDIGQDYQGEITNGRSNKVTVDDLGLAKPLTIGNSRIVFEESRWIPENGYGSQQN